MDCKIGDKFNRLTVIGYGDYYIDRNGRHYPTVNCLCDCGNYCNSVRFSSLKSGHIKSCGCLRNEILILNAKQFSYKRKYNKYDLSGEYGIGWTSNTNKEFYFDLEDYDLIKSYCWYEKIYNSYSRLAMTDENGKTVAMSTLFGYKNYDHADRNPLNNRRSNFRKANKNEQMMNRSVFSNNSSGVSGVGWNDKKQMWVARIQSNGKRIHLGYFDNINDAIVARLNAEKKYFGEFSPQKDLFEKYGI